MTEADNREVVYLMYPTFDDVMLQLLRDTGRTDPWTLETIARLERGESLWLTLF